MVFGKPCVAPGIRVASFDVAADDRSGQPFAVDVADGSARVPAEDSDGGVLVRLGERAVAVVPQQRAAVGARDVQVGVAVEIEVGSDAALAPEGEAGAGLLGHVDEPAVPTLRKSARRRQPASRFPLVALVARVAVHDEEVEPAVAVVVEPAEPAARHRRRVRRLVPAERAVPEAEPARPRRRRRTQRFPGLRAPARTRTGYRTR